MEEDNLMVSMAPIGMPIGVELRETLRVDRCYPAPYPVPTRCHMGQPPIVATFERTPSRSRKTRFGSTRCASNA